MASELVVAVWSGSAATQRSLPIPEDGLVLGRELVDPTTDDRLSRDHARIERRGSAWYLTDAGSRNGTHADGVSVGPEGVEIGPGSVLRTGRTVWMLVANEGAARAAFGAVRMMLRTVEVAAPGLAVHATFVETNLLSPQPEDHVARIAATRALTGEILRGTDILPLPA